MSNDIDYPAIIAGISREMTRWANQDLERYDLETLSAENGAIDKAKWTQLGFTPRVLDEAHEELTESGEYPDLSEYACDNIINELSWNHDKILYKQLQQVAATGFSERDIALWRNSYGWTKHAQKLLARADRISDALNPRNAVVSLNEAVKIIFGEDKVAVADVELIRLAREKYSA